MRDPLTPSKRKQVDKVKDAFLEHRKQNPLYSLLSVSKSVHAAWQAAAISGGYTSVAALNKRAWTEINRQDRGLPPF